MRESNNMSGFCHKYLSRRAIAFGVFILALCLPWFCLSAQAQRRNHLGQKMIRSIQVGKLCEAHFEYDNRDRLSKIVFHGRALDLDFVMTPVKVVLTREKNEVSQVNYMHGLVDTTFIYKWELSGDRVKRCKINERGDIRVTYFDFISDREKLEMIQSHEYSYGEWSSSLYIWDLEHNDWGYFFDSYIFSLNQKELALPNFEDYLANHTWVGNESAWYEKMNFEKYRYSDTEINDTNMNLNTLFSLYAYGKPFGDSKILNHVVLHTEWGGLRENHLAKECRRFNGGSIHQIVYKRDANGNIIEIIYTDDGSEYNPVKNIIYIDYVYE